MTNLIAYIPVLNRQYLEWLEKHQPFELFLISQQTAESLIPRLARNLGALPAETIASMIRSIGLNGVVRRFEPLLIPFGTLFVMPDEDLSHLVALEYLKPDPLYLGIIFEPVWGRWDMTAVKRQEPVIPDLEVSSEKIDQLRMEAAKRLGQKSPDWWRQIGSLAFRGDDLLACAFNAHYPNEYEVAIFCDPRINFDAGDRAGAEVYLSLHAERGTICKCARKGVALEGASLYVDIFPCQDCCRWIVEAGIKEVFFSEGYSALGGLRTLQTAGIRIVKVNS